MEHRVGQDERVGDGREGQVDDHESHREGSFHTLALQCLARPVISDTPVNSGAIPHDAATVDEGSTPCSWGEQKCNEDEIPQSTAQFGHAHSVNPVSSHLPTVPENPALYRAVTTPE